MTEIPVEGNLEGLGAARVVLQRDLDAAENRRAEASLRISDAEDAYRDANEEVIDIETALADLARLEARPKTLTEVAEGDPHR